MWKTSIAVAVMMVSCGKGSSKNSNPAPQDCGTTKQALNCGPEEGQSPDSALEAGSVEPAASIDPADPDMTGPQVSYNFTNATVRADGKTYVVRSGAVTYFKNTTLSITVNKEYLKQASSCSVSTTGNLGVNVRLPVGNELQGTGRGTFTSQNKIDLFMIPVELSDAIYNRFIIELSCMVENQLETTRTELIMADMTFCQQDSPSRFIGFEVETGRKPVCLGRPQDVEGFNQLIQLEIQDQDMNTVDSGYVVKPNNNLTASVSMLPEQLPKYKDVTCKAQLENDLESEQSFVLQPMATQMSAVTTFNPFSLAAFTDEKALRFYCRLQLNESPKAIYLHNKKIKVTYSNQ